MDFMESRPVVKAICLLAWVPHFAAIHAAFHLVWPDAPAVIGALTALLAATLVMIELHLFGKASGDDSLTFDWSQRASRIGLWGGGLAYLLVFGLLMIQLRDQRRVEQMQEREKRDGDAQTIARQAEATAKSIDPETNRKMMELETQRRKH